MLSAPRSTKESPSPPRGTIRLRPGTVVTACFLALAAITLAYVGGVMAGRSSAGKARPPVVQETAQLPAPQAAPPGETARQDAILAPAELAFARALRSDGRTPPDTPSVKASATPPATSQSTPQSMPQTGAVDPAANTGHTAGPVGAASAGTPPLASPQIHDYVFQVAAFRDEDSVDALRQRLEGYGLRTRMQREGKLYLVRVLLRGTEERAGEIMALLESMRLGKPLLIGKTALP